GYAERGLGGSRSRRATAARGEHGGQLAAGVARDGFRYRHPHVPVRTVALEPEQQVGRGAAGKAFRSQADLHSAARKPRVPRVFQLGSEVTRPACRTPQATPRALYTKDRSRAWGRSAGRGLRHSSSCWPLPSTPSTRSRSARTRTPTPLSTRDSRSLIRRNSWARLSAAITAMRSRPTTLPLSRISRMRLLRNSAASSSAERSSYGQATTYSLSMMR